MNYLWIIMILVQGAAWAGETAANAGPGELTPSEPKEAEFLPEKYSQREQNEAENLRKAEEMRQKQLEWQKPRNEQQKPKSELQKQNRFIIPESKIQELAQNREEQQPVENRLEQPRSKEEFSMSTNETMKFAQEWEQRKQQEQEKKGESPQNKSRMDSLDAVQELAQKTYGIGPEAFNIEKTPVTQPISKPQSVPKPPPTEAELKVMHEKARALEAQANKMFPDPVTSPYDSVENVGLPPKADQKAQNVQKVNENLKKDFEAKKANFGKALAQEKEALKGLLGFKSLSAERRKGLEDVKSILHLEGLHSERNTVSQSEQFSLEKLNKAIDKAKKSGSFFDKLFERKKLASHNQNLESMRRTLTEHYQKLQQAHEKVKTVEAVRG